MATLAAISPNPSTVKTTDMKAKHSATYLAPLHSENDWSPTIPAVLYAPGAHTLCGNCFPLLASGLSLQHRNYKSLVRD